MEMSPQLAQYGLDYPFYMASQGCAYWPEPLTSDIAYVITLAANVGRAFASPMYRDSHAFLGYKYAAQSSPVVPQF